MKEIIGYSMAHVPIPKMEEEQETRLVVYYDIQDISAPTTICTNYDSSIKSIEVDGVLLDDVVTTYQFGSVGEHIIKYEFNDPTTVGKYAPLFSSIATIKRVVIPNTFTAIGNAAFNYCTGLTSVNIPNSVTSIGNSAFYNCSGLTSVTIPNSVTSIGENAFMECMGLTSVTVGNSVTSIGDKAFDRTEALEVLNYNAKCELEYSIRGSWWNLKTVVIGDSTPSIGASAFGSCTGLTNVTIGSGVTSIGNSAFGNCTGLTNVTIPNSVITIGHFAFNNCINLTSVTIGSSVTSIGNSAFSNSNLTNITSLATTAPTIQNGTFQSVKTNGTLTVPSGSSGYDVWMGTGDYYLGKYGWTKAEQ